MTIKEKFTIFHTNTAYTSRRYIWTAITRAVDFRNITIFEHSKKECEKLNECKLKQYFKLKIENYKQQDNMAKRVFKDEDYVDYDWIMKNKQCCMYCLENFYFNIEDACTSSNFSIDRVSNLNAHIKNNCLLSCIHCNTSKH